MQRLALYFDGTWNEKVDTTNVFRVFSLAADSAQQRSRYFPGVVSRPGHRFRGSVLGEGLAENVKAGYNWLRQCYDWSAGEEGNRIFLFGFSRGAYTARSLGGLIASCGLPVDATLGTDWLYERYRDRRPDVVPIWQLEHIRRTGTRALTEEETLLLEHSRRVDIEMLGVWDTVGALGIPWTVPVLHRARYHFRDHDLGTIYRHAFHALAIDEHRGAFRPTLWTLHQPGKNPVPPQEVALERCEQRWFPGAHADVGGGSRSPLEDAPGRWLQDKAQQLGLQYLALLSVNPAAASTTRASDSWGIFLKGFYKVLKFGRRFHRPIGVRRNLVKGGWSWPVNETIDDSAFTHGNGGAGYPPKNLREWSAAVAGRAPVLHRGSRIARRP